MSKISSAGISILILLILISGANAIAVENIKKIDVSTTDLKDVVINPEGTKLAFVAIDDKNTQQIFVINTDGSGEKKITDDAKKKWGLAWGKDKIAYISYGEGGLEKIFVINPDGTGNKQLISDNTRQGNFERYMVAWGSPSWSPDGKLLVYTSLDEREMQKMYKVIADGSGKVAVLDEKSSRQWSPAFGHDGKNIVFVSYPAEKNKEELFIFDGNAGKQLTFDEIKKNYPVWGPEGTIVFVSFESVASSNEKLFAIEKDGNNKRLFVNADTKQRYPSFSSDGGKFAYAAIDVAGNVKIAVGDVTGITAATTTPVITTAAPTIAKTSVTPAATAQTQEKEGNGVWLIMILAGAVLLALVAIASKNYFKKK